MNSEFHKSRNFIKTFGTYFVKHKRYRSWTRCRGMSASCISSPSLPVCVHQCRWNSSFPAAASPDMNYSQPWEKTIKTESKGQLSNVIEAQGWVIVGAYRIFAWSVSGIESCIIVRSEAVQLVFDMGLAVPESIQVPNNFITHGSIDHIGAVASHIAKRANTGLRPARYYMPSHLVQPMREIVNAHAEMAQAPEFADSVNKILPFCEGDTVRLNSSHIVKTFPTVHQIPSQGYILYKEEKTLKDDYKRMEGVELANLEKRGVRVHDASVTPEVAYCGDTVFDVFTKPPNPDLLRVKVLITEATFLDDEFGKDIIQRAKERGHSHLTEFARNAEVFKDVGHIVLIHFLHKYPSQYILDKVHGRLPSELQGRVTPAVVAKSTVASTFFF